jgi:hypothetical protein
MKYFTIQFWALFAAAICAIPAFATPATDPLTEQVKLMSDISPYVERVDMARLLVVKNTSQSVIDDMVKNVATGKKEVTFQTLRLIQNLIIQYRFSQVFFGWTDPRAITSIYTPQTEQSLARLKTLSEQLVNEYGYDDSPYTQITANTFRQMQRLLKQLEDLPIDSALKAKLRALWMPIGETIAVAEQGDRPKTFEKAIPVIRQIQAMYSEFDRISSSQAGFPMIMELQGLTEFYAEFAQVDQ